MARLVYLFSCQKPNRNEGQITRISLLKGALLKRFSWQPSWGFPYLIFVPGQLESEILALKRNGTTALDLT